MSEQDELLEPDLIDRIANALPVEVRAEFYRELRHCRSLPENDEMLRILRAMHFSVLIMVEVPARMATERERFEQTAAGTTKLLQDVRQFTEEHQRQIDERLDQVSADIAEALKPEAVAAAINESLRQQFVKTTIPQTANALAVTAAQIKKTSDDFVEVAGKLGATYDSAAAEARRAIQQLERASSKALESTKRGADELMQALGKEYRWWFFVFVILAFVLGIGLGWECGYLRDQRPAVVHAPVMQAPEVKPATPVKPKTRH
jgi:SHS2 domain-containing protein